MNDDRIVYELQELKKAVIESSRFNCDAIAEKLDGVIDRINSTNHSLIQDISEKFEKLSENQHWVNEAKKLYLKNIEAHVRYIKYFVFVSSILLLLILGIVSDIISISF